MQFDHNTTPISRSSATHVYRNASSIKKGSSATALASFRAKPGGAGADANADCHNDGGTKSSPRGSPSKEKGGRAVRWISWPAKAGVELVVLRQCSFFGSSSSRCAACLSYTIDARVWRGSSRIPSATPNTSESNGDMVAVVAVGSNSNAASATDSGDANPLFIPVHRGVLPDATYPGVMLSTSNGTFCADASALKDSAKWFTAAFVAP